MARGTCRSTTVTSLYHPQTLNARLRPGTIGPPVAAEHVICTLPFSVLRSIPADFAPSTRAAIAALSYVPAGKAAFQATRRFWEEDEGI
ncbi:FAD-dependent oxidoreductase, partial [bacterium]|nr:FAD-dependent oxidoreductase [bacterium]